MLVLAVLAVLFFFLLSPYPINYEYHDQHQLVLLFVLVSSVVLDHFEDFAVLDYLANSVALDYLVSFVVLDYLANFVALDYLVSFVVLDYLVNSVALDYLVNSVVLLSPITTLEI